MPWISKESDNSFFVVRTFLSMYDENYLHMRGLATSMRYSSSRQPGETTANGGSAAFTLNVHLDVTSNMGTSLGRWDAGKDPFGLVLRLSLSEGKADGRSTHLDPRNATVLFMLGHPSMRGLSFPSGLASRRKRRRCGQRHRMRQGQPAGTFHNLTTK
jgi:hypothetical protein